LAGAGLLMAAIGFLIGYLVLRGPRETAIRTYLAFPIPGKKFEIGFDFPFTQYAVAVPPDTLKVSATKSGRCTARSVVAPGRADAWQCTTDNPTRRFDPCFRNV